LYTDSAADLMAVATSGLISSPTSSPNSINRSPLEFSSRGRFCDHHGCEDSDLFYVTKKIILKLQIIFALLPLEKYLLASYQQKFI
jgi:hypothetical protein